MISIISIWRGKDNVWNEELYAGWYYDMQCSHSFKKSPSSFHSRLTYSFNLMFHVMRISAATWRLRLWAHWSKETVKSDYKTNTFYYWWSITTSAQSVEWCAVVCECECQLSFNILPFIITNYKLLKFYCQLIFLILFISCLSGINLKQIYFLLRPSYASLHCGTKVKTKKKWIFRHTATIIIR